MEPAAANSVALSSKPAEASTPAAGKAATKKAGSLRHIAPLPFKRTLPAKAVDAAIRHAMAGRSAEADQAVRVAVQAAVDCAVAGPAPKSTAEQAR